MILISQNITNYDIPIPENSVFRINLAWINSITELTKLLEIHKSHSVFLDLPVNRTKPPNNNYSLNDIALLFEINFFLNIIIQFLPLVDFAPLLELCFFNLLNKLLV